MQFSLFDPSETWINAQEGILHGHSYCNTFYIQQFPPSNKPNQASKRVFSANEMAKSTSFQLTAVFLLAFSPMFCFSLYNQGGYLYPQFYDHSCPQLQHIVRYVVENAVAKDPRMAASLLRLSFHDCFVQVCLLIRSSLIKRARFVQLVISPGF